MAEFKDLLKKWFYQNSSSAGTTSSRIPLLDASGNPIGSNTMENVSKLMMQAMPMAGVFVVVPYSSDSRPQFWPADRALTPSIASAAIGAGIVEGGRTLIIAKDTQSLKWANSGVSGGSGYITNREQAIADFTGRTRTATIVNTLGDNAPAAKYCHEYYPSSVASNDAYFGAGRWWLPSEGEVGMIWSHVRQINFVLNAIGGTTIPVGASGSLWSSTEHSASNAWYLNTSSAYFYYNGKTFAYGARPVTAYY